MNKKCWISVKDKFPAKSQRVLIRYSKGVILVDMFDSYLKKFPFERLYGKVTHWAVLPKKNDEGWITDQKPKELRKVLVLYGNDHVDISFMTSMDNKFLYENLYRGVKAWMSIPELSSLGEI
ncbi:MAG: DUF551 domain-containing protein [Ruminococcaceae bacterium]|nr:DUF551 domain-containing protein [Oscillospiraceae bacterium]